MENIKLKFLSVFLLCCFYGWQASAADCNADNLSQTDMNICNSNYAKKIDDELNEVYNSLLQKISKDSQVKLAVAKKAWLEFRAKQCEFNTLGSDGGSVHSTVISICYSELTEDYIKLLKSQLNCEEGDLSCGGQ